MAVEKLVVRFDHWIDPVFDRSIGQEPGVSLEVLSREASGSATVKRLAAAHVYHISPAVNELPLQWRANEELLAQCPNLLCVSSGGAGHDTVDVEACTRAGVAVVNQVGGNAASVAEYAIGMMLAVSRRIAESDRKLRSTRGYSREDLMGHEITGKTLGLVGIGHTGRAVAGLARAFRMRLLAYDPLLSPEEIAARGAQSVDLPTLLAQSDIVSLHCPLDSSTRNLMDAEAFAKMKKGAIFISMARGGVHDEPALHAALTSGHLAGAGLDVWKSEPPALDHPLLALDNVVAGFHTAGVSHEGRRNVAAMAASQILALLRGETPPRLVNPDVWPGLRARFARLLGMRLA